MIVQFDKKPLPNYLLISLGKMVAGDHLFIHQDDYTNLDSLIEHLEKEAQKYNLKLHFERAYDGLDVWCTWSRRMDNQNLELLVYKYIASHVGIGVSKTMITNRFQTYRKRIDSVLLDLVHDKKIKLVGSDIVAKRGRPSIVYIAIDTASN